MGSQENARAVIPGGVLDLLILRSLAQGPMHGYEIAEHIGRLSEDVLRLGEGTLYPTLQRLLIKGWVVAEWGVSINNRRARYYRLTGGWTKAVGLGDGGVSASCCGHRSSARTRLAPRITEASPMGWLGEQWRTFKMRWRRDRHDQELADEMALHLELRAERLREAGLSPQDARNTASRQFGNVTLQRDLSRDVWGWPRVETIYQDLRYAMRQIRKSPGFAAVVIITMALGIGANTAVFALLHGLLLRSPAVGDADRLVVLFASQEGRSPYRRLSYPNYLDVQARARYAGVAGGVLLASASGSVDQRQWSSRARVGATRLGQLFRRPGSSRSSGAHVRPCRGSRTKHRSCHRGQPRFLAGTAWRGPFSGGKDHSA